MKADENRGDQIIAFCRAAAKSKWLSFQIPIPVAVALLFVLVPALLTEVTLGTLFPEMFRWRLDEKSLTYRYDAQLGWFPIANSKTSVSYSRPISVTHNSIGFRGAEHTKTDKPVMLFLGDSFVWGYDVEVSERFTEKLQAKHPEWAIRNLGVSGYGTDQEYLVLQQYFDTYKPRVVFLMFCTKNDPDDNSLNFNSGLYKPYFTTNGGALKLNGIPAPRAEGVFRANHDRLCRSRLMLLLARAYYRLTAPTPTRFDDPTRAILTDMQKYLQSKGVPLLVGFTTSYPALETFLTDVGIPHLDVSTPQRYVGFGEHWTPEGHSIVCDKIEEFLSQPPNNYLGSKQRLSP